MIRKDDFEKSKKLIIMIRRGCQDDGGDIVDDVGMTMMTMMIMMTMMTITMMLVMIMTKMMMILMKLIFACCCQESDQECRFEGRGTGIL